MIEQIQDSFVSDLALAHRLADMADKYALSFFQTNFSPILKQDGTPVTRIDFEIEQKMKTILSKERPDDAILGEEFGLTKQANRCWILDPIDGTSEYIAGKKYWGTHIALEENDELILGLISRPALNRRWWATKGKGAYHAKSFDLDEPLPVNLSLSKHLSQSKIAIWERVQTKRVEKFQDMSVWIPPSLKNMIEFLDGEIDAFVDVIGKPWDHAPVAIIVEEAGGTFQDSQGGRRIDLGEVRYTNGKIDTEFFRILTHFQDLEEKHLF
ncbi:hypothetical protein COW36_11390 [bacterium (Candidatus Blackallbacteria) CG17_big_fil_post_rev_8_21_14_2_50_48_46]|uniref:Histidinol-phosphatase n=1 Tax=bacterium (Candidatus Blackallbacteria) CG17_big_fil_post_rev_8_21_14_2_50_48_46 TaxID=2014261 RepID=A0A2M7G4N0_9BACT|nr:MAG: hypothetical protein COW64_18485 [bacterium (Candidatus Blackallbacteria) CG18_big_fil_WC_8_21_14_2_50_49_26]PIW16878.1 MAG: hypothetical protein COW36_11390 [bacterium (Candidatus Blackallbacteria) CG17_big_fil_post_rev_8_21_14_2_50_48_46]PIW48075.1 MAG: hypothetical protein COW20_11105 [bacterium (Candidatus Blackallbacteria) CG13_big_fil_rev_8_21_14_2_50_49_14]